MARKPNYQFERMQRDRAKAAKVADKAAAKQRQREGGLGCEGPGASSPKAED